MSQPKFFLERRRRIAEEEEDERAEMEQSHQEEYYDHGFLNGFAEEEEQQEQAEEYDAESIAQENRNRTYFLNLVSQQHNLSSEFEDLAHHRFTASPRHSSSQNNNNQQHPKITTSEVLPLGELKDMLTQQNQMYFEELKQRDKVIQDLAQRIDQILKKQEKRKQEKNNIISVDLQSPTRSRASPIRDFESSPRQYHHHHHQQENQIETENREENDDDDDDDDDEENKSFMEILTSRLERHVKNVENLASVISNMHAKFQEEHKKFKEDIAKLIAEETQRLRKLYHSPTRSSMSSNGFLRPKSISPTHASVQRRLINEKSEETESTATATTTSSSSTTTTDDAERVFSRFKLDIDKKLNELNQLKKSSNSSSPSSTSWMMDHNNLVSDLSAPAPLLSPLLTDVPHSPTTASSSSSILKTSASTLPSPLPLPPPPPTPASTTLNASAQTENRGVSAELEKLRQKILGFHRKKKKEEEKKKKKQKGEKAESSEDDDEERDGEEEEELESLDSSSTSTTTTTTAASSFFSGNQNEENNASEPFELAPSDIEIEKSKTIHNNNNNNGNSKIAFSPSSSSSSNPKSLFLKIPSPITSSADDLLLKPRKSPAHHTSPSSSSSPPNATYSSSSSSSSPQKPSTSSLLSTLKDPVIMFDFYSKMARSFYGQKGVAGFDDGGFKRATITSPGALVVSKSGKNIFFSDDGQRIRKISLSDGLITTLVSQRSFASTYSLNHAHNNKQQQTKPTSMCTDDNFIYFTANGTVYKVDASKGVVWDLFFGTVSSSGGGTAANKSKSIEKLVDPRGCALDSTGNLLVTHRGGLSVMQHAQSSKIVLLVASGQNARDGNFSRALLCDPRGIVAIDDNTFVVADSGSNSLRTINLRERSVETLCGGTGPNAGTERDGSFEECGFQRPTHVCKWLPSNFVSGTNTTNHTNSSSRNDNPMHHALLFVTEEANSDRVRVVDLAHRRVSSLLLTATTGGGDNKQQPLSSSSSLSVVPGGIAVSNQKGAASLEKKGASSSAAAAAGILIYVSMPGENQIQRIELG